MVTPTDRMLAATLAGLAAGVLLAYGAGVVAWRRWRWVR